VWAALAKPLVNVDFGRDRYTADVDEMQVCSSDLGLSCDICGNTAHELYTFRCYKKRPPGADVTGEDHRRLHRCKAFLGKDCGKGLLGKRSEHSKALEGLEKVLMQPDADEQLQVLYASSSRKIQRLIEEQLSFYSHRGAGGDMRPRSWTPSDDKDMSSRRSMSAAVGGAGARRICKFYGVREYQGHPACGVDFLSGRLRDYGWESNKSLLSHGLSERDKRGPRLRHSVPCDPYDPYRVIHTVQDKLVLKLAAARTLRNHHTVAGWSLPLSVYPPSLSLSLSLSVTEGSNIGVGGILLMTSVARSGSVATYSHTTAPSSTVGLTGVRSATRLKTFSTSASTSAPPNTRLESRSVTSPSLQSRRVPSSPLGMRSSALRVRQSVACRRIRGSRVPRRRL